jgi:hypothetical protein
MTRTDAADRVLDPLETIAGRGFTRYDVFDDWVSLMLAALQRDDDRYCDILDSYKRGRSRDRGDRNADLFSAAFHELRAAMSETNRDVLGEAYEAWGMQSEAFGQHFTPHPVCEMKAALVVDDDPADPPVTIADPACGSGRLLVLAARQTDAPTVCVGEDKDELCAKIAALNACFFNMDAVVLHGNSLTLDHYRAWRTVGTAFGGEIAEVDPDDMPVPEAAFEDAADASDGADDEPAADRVAVATDADLEQADLGEWSA